MSTGPVVSMFNTMELLRKHKNAGFEDEQARFRDEQERKKAQWADEDRAETVADRERVKADRQAVIDATAPAAVEEVDQAGPVRPGEQLDPALQVKGKTFTDRAAADKAVGEYNGLPATMARVAPALMKRGNVSGAVAAQKGAMALDEGMKADLDRRFNDDVEARVTDWNTAAQFATDSAFDGGAGTIQYRFQPSADGKTMVPEVSVDGQNWQSKPGGRVYSNDATGFLEAKSDLKKLPTEKKLDHLYARQKAEADAAKADAQAKRDSDRLDLERRRVEAMENRAVTGRRGSGGGGDADGDGVDDEGFARVDMGGIDKQIDEYLGGKDADGVDIKPDPKAKLVIRTLAAKNPASSQDPAGAALEAIEFYNSQLQAAGGDHAKAQQRIAVVLAMMKNGDTQANFELGGVKGGIDARGRAAAPAGPAAPPSPQPAPGAAPQPKPVSMRDAMVGTAGRDAALQKIMGEKASAVEQLVAAHQQAKQLMRGAAASGDPRSVALYSKQLQQARTALEQALGGLPAPVRQQALAAADQ